MKSKFPDITTGAVTICLLLLGIAVGSFADKLDNRLKGYDKEIVDSERATIALREGKAFFYDGILDLARLKMETVNSIDRNNPSGRYFLGRIEARENRHNLAVEHYLATYEMVSDYDSLAYHLGKSYLSLGDCESASKWIDRIGKKKLSPIDRRKFEREADDCRKRKEK